MPETKIVQSFQTAFRYPHTENVLQYKCVNIQHNFNMYYPYSTQATNRPNRHELIFFSYLGEFVRFHYFFFSNRDELRVIPDSDTMSLRIFGAIGSIRLESRKNSLRLENNIRTCCTKVKESITNQLRICEMQHELGTN